jgi:hypothetical protein
VNYPNSVDSDETPEATIENVPDDVLEATLSYAVTYKACPDCGREQFIPVVPGHNSTRDCRECGFEMKVIG